MLPPAVGVATCMYMMEYTERVQQGASEANPPACNNYYYILATPTAKT